MAFFDFVRSIFGIPVVSPRAAHPEDEDEPSDPLWGWNKDRIQAAAVSMDGGDFAEAEDLYEGMTRYGRIASALERRAEGVRAFPFELEIKEGTPKTIELFAEQLEGLDSLAVGDARIADTAEVVQQGVLGADARVVQPGGNRPRLLDLPLVVLQQIGHGAV